MRLVHHDERHAERWHVDASVELLGELSSVQRVEDVGPTVDGSIGQQAVSVELAQHREKHLCWHRIAIDENSLASKRRFCQRDKAAAASTSMALPLSHAASDRRAKGARLSHKRIVVV